MPLTPLALFTDPSDANLPLAELRDAYADYLRGRERPASNKTVLHYTSSIESFERSLALHGKPGVLGEVTVTNVRAWVKDMRTGALPSNSSRPHGGCTDDTIAPRISGLKTFTRKYVTKELKLTTRDLLEDLPRFEPKEKARQMLTEAEIKAVRDCFTLPTFEHVRDRAIFEVHLATAMRYDTVMSVPLAALDKISGRLIVTTKGGKEIHGRIDTKAMAHVRAYLRLRPDTGCPNLFVTDEGEALTYWGGRQIWKRMKRRSGVERLGSHLIRHTFAQRMALQGAPVADIQDVLGHESDKMARHYAGAARKYAAADIMTKYSLAS